MRVTDAVARCVREGGQEGRYDGPSTSHDWREGIDSNEGVVHVIIIILIKKTKTFMLDKNMQRNIGGKTAKKTDLLSVGYITTWFTYQKLSSYLLFVCMKAIILKVETQLIQR